MLINPKLQASLRSCIVYFNIISKAPLSYAMSYKLCRGLVACIYNIHILFSEYPVVWKRISKTFNAERNIYGSLRVTHTLDFKDLFVQNPCISGWKC